MYQFKTKVIIQLLIIIFIYIKPFTIYAQEINSEIEHKATSFTELMKMLSIYEKTITFADIFEIKPTPRPEIVSQDNNNKTNLTLSISSPTPKPITRKKEIITPLELDGLFTKYAKEYNVSKETLKNIAYCESTFKPNATNYTYVGLFQFSPSTWISNRKAMGLDPNIDLRLNAEESIKTAAYKINRDGTGAWPVCQYR